MAQTKPVFFHIFWHQHQPWYVIPGSSQSIMPWVRLHGVKDYYDIAWLSREYEGWKQTINLVPSLLDQIQRYADGSLTDESWTLSQKSARDLTLDEKKKILERFFDAHAPRMIHPFPRYDELLRKRGRSPGKAADRFTDQDILDLQVWHNLTWIDPIWRENPELPLRDLIKKQRDFSEDDKQTILNIQREILKKIIPIHRDLFLQGKIQLTCSPYYHPILPLLCNTAIATVSNPRDPVPDPSFSAPDDAQWHIQEGIADFVRIMGFLPSGMWPSEGSVSDAACALMARNKIPFFATDEGILFRSTFINNGGEQDRSQLYRLHCLETREGKIDCAFRDHGLSDLIGFVYQNWNAKDAARDFISHLKTIGNSWNDKIPPLVSVILDGENCWEFYPRDGHDFLRYLIEGILHDPQIIPTTVPEFRKQYPAEPTLRSIHPGSWINSNFRIWIGHQEDNSAWHFLRQAREALVRKEPKLDETTRRTAWNMLHIAEGSDWFWWYGDINSSAHEMLFDQLFRSHLIYLYEQIGVPVPETLRRPIKQPKKALIGGGILFHQPVINSRRGGYYEWVGTHSIAAASGGGAMHQAKEEVEATLHYGRLNKFLTLYVQFKQETPLRDNCRVQLHITKPLVQSLTISPSPNQDRVKQTDNTFEAIVDLQEAGIDPRQEAWFFLEFEPEGEASFTIPHGSELYLHGYNAANASLYWFV